MIFESPLEWISLALGLWGTILSTFLFVKELLNVRRRVKVNVKFHIRADPSGKEGSLEIYAINIGNRPVNLVDAGFLFEDGSDGYLVIKSSFPSPLPILLTDGESVAVKYDLSDIAGPVIISSKGNIGIKKAYMKDAEGKVYSSRLSKNILDFLQNW